MNKITIIDNLKIIENNNEKICIKKNKDKKILEKYNYLKSKDFFEYPKTIIINNNEKRKYIDEIITSKEDKLNELIKVLLMLHTKTTYYKSLTLDEIKEFYEKETNDLIEIKKYYENIVDENIFYSYQKPSMLNLIINTSLILISLDKSKYYLDLWYKIIKNKKSKRVVMNHYNLKLSNFIKGEETFLINWDNSKYDYQIYDLESLFKNNYKYLDMPSIYELYNSKYTLYEEEKYLFFYLILKIDKLNFIKNDLINTKNVSNIVFYLKKINEFLEKYVKN